MTLRALRCVRRFSSASTTQQSPYVQTIVDDASSINLGIGQPSPSMLQPLMRPLGAAAASAFSQDADACLLQYGAGRGTEPFRVALAAFLSRQHGYTVRADELMVTSGNSAALDMVSTVLLHRGNHENDSSGITSSTSAVATAATAARPIVYAEDPTYFLAGGVFADHGAIVHGVPLDSDGVCVEHLRSALEVKAASSVARGHDGARAGAAMLYTVPNYQNPTGLTMSGARRRALLQVCSDHGLPIVCDEPYNLLGFDEAAPVADSLLRAQRQLAAAGGGNGCGDGDGGGDDARDGNAVAAAASVISLGSFSKIMAPGLRLGWIQAPPHIITSLTGFGATVSGGGSSPVAAALVQTLLESGEADALLVRTRSLLRRRAHALHDAVQQHLVVPHGFAVAGAPAGGYFLWLRLPDDVSASAFEQAAAEQGVRFTPGRRCSACAVATANDLDRHVRLSFAFYSEGELVEATKRMAAAALSVKLRVPRCS